MAAGTRTASIRSIHRLSALVLGAFLALHMANHAVGLAGQAEHMRFMAAVRPFYRHALVEPVLLALLLVQISSGLAMALRRWRESADWVARLQIISGIYVALFIANHVIAVLAGRWALGLDTDFRFAAAGMHVPPFPWFFLPYYWLGVAAIFSHAGCAMHWALFDRNITLARGVLWISILAGVALATAIVAALAGVLYPVNIPAPYLETYGV
jgi:succinate dehydrogenase/fumarate reductase cytochrome b subunit